MRNLPYDLLVEKNKQTNTMIDLLLVEVSKAYIGYCQMGSTTGTVVVDSDLATELTGLDFSSSTGYGWIISFEKGRNKGSRRLVSSVVGDTITLATNLDYTQDVTGDDKFRIAKYLYLAIWNTPVSFYIPDNSDSDGEAITYIPFPASVSPVGTTITGEVLSMSVDVSNVSKLIGNYVQNANGLRGNRVIHLRVFDGYLDNKTYCIKDIMYIDTVSISPHTVDFSLESKFNIVGIQIPLRTYERNYCQWIFKSSECGWTNDENGTDDDFPLASTTTCDHSLSGPNGCLAHKNTARYGAFPAIPNLG